MNLMFAGDFHLKESDLEECKLILKELTELIKSCNVDGLIITGDTFDQIRPTSKEIDLFSNFVKEINIPITMLAANSHESSTQEDSICNHFGILKNTIHVVKEYRDDDLFVGHFIVNESTKNYGGTTSKKDLEIYKKVILGHGHSFEEIKPNIIQLGSIRYVDFAESKDKAKYVALCENYKTYGEKWSYLPLTTPYSMVDVIVEPGVPSVKSQCKKWLNTLNSLPEKTKVRILFSDFESYSNSINELEHFKQKFVKFQFKKDFLIQDLSLGSIKKDQTNLKDSLKKFLETNKVSEEIRKILLDEIK